MPSRSARSSHGSASAQRPGARERPAERVVAVDRRPLGTGARARDAPSPRAGCGGRRGRPRDSRSTRSAVRGQQPVDRRDGRSLARRRRASGPAGRAGRRAARRTAAAARRSPPAAPSRPRRRAGPARRRPGPAARARDVAGEDRERRAHVPRGCVDAAVAELELRELDVRPRGRLGDAARGVERELHRRDGARAVAASAHARRRCGRRRRGSASAAAIRSNAANACG